MGHGISLTGVKMAGVLIDCTLEDQSWCMEMVGTYLKRFLGKRVKQNVAEIRKQKRKAA